MNKERIEGFFVPFSPQEFEQIKKALKIEGYEENSLGLREFLLDILLKEEVRTDPTEEIIAKAREYVRRNPEKIHLGVSMAKTVINMIKPRRT